MSLPARGEVRLCDLGMIAKVRPVLVLNVPFGDEDYALPHVAPHTTAFRGSHFEVAMAAPWLKRGVFNIQGSLPIPRSNFPRHLGTLNEDQLAQIKDGV